VPTEPAEFLALTILTAGAAIVALITVVVIYLVQAGRHRACLAPAALSLSLVGPVCGIGAASKHLAQTFADMANSGGGGAAALIAGCTRAQSLMRLGDGAAIITLVLAAGLGWLGVRSPSQAGHRQASVRRLSALFALFLFPVIAVGCLHEYVRATNRIAVGVAEAPTAKPGASGEGPVVVQALVSRMTRGVFVGFFGALVLLGALATFAISSAILAWKVVAPSSCRIASTALLLMAAALAAAGILLFDRPIPLPR
jgi:hypothetical protein